MIWPKDYSANELRIIGFISLHPTPTLRAVRPKRATKLTRQPDILSDT
jgi:hypothetical protein